jgi:hypothetical protein
MIPEMHMVALGDHNSIQEHQRAFHTLLARRLPMDLRVDDLHEADRYPESILLQSFLDFEVLG